MNANELRAQYIALRKQSDLSPAEFDKKVRWTLQAEGCTNLARCAPEEWVRVADEVLHPVIFRGEGKGFTGCRRCGGAGVLVAFQHVDGGVCYECGGSGK